jgi:hypothetical protein
MNYDTLSVLFNVGFIATVFCAFLLIYRENTRQTISKKVSEIDRLNDLLEKEKIARRIDQSVNSTKEELADLIEIIRSESETALNKMSDAVELSQKDNSPTFRPEKVDEASTHMKVTPRKVGA